MQSDSIVWIIVYEQVEIPTFWTKSVYDITDYIQVSSPFCDDMVQICISQEIDY